MPLERLPGELPPERDRLVESACPLVHLGCNGRRGERGIVVGTEQFVERGERLRERLGGPLRVVRRRPGVHVEQKPGPLRRVERRLDFPLGRVVTMLHEQRAAVAGGVGMARLREERAVQLDRFFEERRRLLRLRSLDEDVGREFVDRQEVRRRLAFGLLHLAGRDPQRVERLLVLPFLAEGPRLLDRGPDGRLGERRLGRRLVGGRVLRCGTLRPDEREGHEHRHMECRTRPAGPGGDQCCMRHPWEPLPEAHRTSPAHDRDTRTVSLDRFVARR